MVQNEVPYALAPGDSIYVISAEFDTHLQLVGWHPDQAEAEWIRAAMQAHSDQKPEQPDW